MKKILSIVLSIIIMSTLILSGCGNTSTSSSSSLNIGIVQIMEHPSLDAARQGFLDALAENGYKEGENLSIN